MMFGFWLLQHATKMHNDKQLRAINAKHRCLQFKVAPFRTTRGALSLL